MEIYFLMTGFIFLVDLDGTLTRSELLPLIAKRFNLEKSIADLTYQCVWGKIPFAEGFLRRIDMLKSIPISHIKEIIDTVVLNESLVSFMQHNVDSCYIHENNFIQGVKSVLNKRDIIQKLKKNFSAKRFIAIGEGHNDAEMMELADVSIAYGGVHAPANSVMETASHVIFDEETLLSELSRLILPEPSTSVYFEVPGG